MCQRLLQVGQEVVALVNFIPYYLRALKLANLANLHGHHRFLSSLWVGPRNEGLVRQVAWQKARPLRRSAFSFALYL
jgi:hypothetical protein